MNSPAGAQTVMIAGATGHLGRKVLAAARARGYTVRALVRPGSHLGAAAAGVDIFTGDLLDPASLRRACAGASAVITTAIGYSQRKPGDRSLPTDRQGQFNLIEAARSVGVRRFVFTSVLTCDQAPDVPHFYDKYRVEQELAASGLDYVALRPGAFVDQSQDFWVNGLRNRRLDALGDPGVPWSYVHTEDLARMLVAAVDLPAGAPRVIDVGCDRPVAMNEIATIFTDLLQRPVRVRALPWPIANVLFALQSLRNPWMGDFRRMFAYILCGGYVANLDAQRQWLGPPPTIESALERYARGAGLLRENFANG